MSATPAHPASVPQTVVTVAKPETVPLELREGFAFVTVTIAGKPYRFMIDSGSQTNVIDPRVAHALGVQPQGIFEVNGARQVSSEGLVTLDGFKIGDAAFPASEAAVLDIQKVADDPIDGVLGFPFFESAEVRMDFDKKTVTIGTPGSLSPQGDRIAVDTRDEWPEIAGNINRVPAKLLIDTGDTNELLLFKNFVDAHPDVVEVSAFNFSQNRAVGGSMHVLRTVVSELDLGAQKLFKRYTEVLTETKGVFADPTIGANVGLASLKQFVVTFDLADESMFLQQSASFDDGRFRRFSMPADGMPPGP